MATIATAPGAPIRGPFAAAWQYRELFRQLVLRNLKVRYQRSGLGFLWLLVNPSMTVAILVVVFGHIVRLPIPSYWAFLISGYFAWVFFLHTLGTSTYVITEHASMAKSVAVPPDVFVMSAVMSRLIEFVVEMMLVMAVLAVFHHHRLPASFVLVPVLIALLLVMTLGLALPAAALSVFFRDIQHGLPPALQMLMYLSPVFYSSDLVPPVLAPLYALNPLALVLSLFHTVLYAGELPSALHLIQATVLSAVVYLIGYAVFRRQSRLFAEII
jgi:ABC-type polysaccharide/polyol phosphate export permease